MCQLTNWLRQLNGMENRKPLSFTASHLDKSLLGQGGSGCCVHASKGGQEVRQITEMTPK